MGTKCTYDGEGIIRNLDVDGLTVLDGVKIGGKSAWATAFVTDEGEIKTEHGGFNVDNTIKPRGFFDLPVARQLKKIKGMVKSANFFTMRSIERQPEDDDDEGEQESFLSNVLEWLVGFVVISAIAVFVITPIFLPIFTASFFWPVVNENVYIVGLLEGIQRVLLCCVFLYFMPKIFSLFSINAKNMWKFHGAEHKAIHCYESNDALTIENIKKYSCRHLRCSSNMAALILALALCFNLFLPVQSIWWRLLITVAAIPFVVIIALELNDWRMSHYNSLKSSHRTSLRIRASLRLRSSRVQRNVALPPPATGSGRAPFIRSCPSELGRDPHSLDYKNIIAKILSVPGYLLQYIVTRAPDDKMIEVALASINKVLQLERSNETEIIVADGVLSISDNAFENCAKLVKVHIPDGVKSIGKMAFYKCPKLKDVVLPGGLETIGAYAFSECASLERIHIPASVKRIEARAFFNCSNLSEVTIDGKPLWGGECFAGSLFSLPYVKIKFQNGSQYEGGFVNGEMHGKGVCRYSDGGKYVGDFVNGKFHGKGKVTYSNGNHYKGGFSNGKFYGKGKYIVCGPDENALKTFDGEWDDGEYFSGRIMAADGTYEDVERYKSRR